MRLFSGNYSRAYKPGGAHWTDIQAGSGLGLSDPTVCLLCLRAVRGNAVILSERSHSAPGPRFSAGSLDVFSIEDAGNRRIVEHFAECIDHHRQILDL